MSIKQIQNKYKHSATTGKMRSYLTEMYSSQAIGKIFLRLSNVCTEMLVRLKSTGLLPRNFARGQLNAIGFTVPC